MVSNASVGCLAVPGVDFGDVDQLLDDGVDHLGDGGELFGDGVDHLLSSFQRRWKPKSPGGDIVQVAGLTDSIFLQTHLQAPY